ncbi:MAG: DNA-binding protein [Clostridia bacterium]|nr:DNA-binding protein [Clostridia bacterium]
MTLDETILFSSLYNIYGELLTNKQKQIFESYVFNNLSLAEIAENFGISRQAVLDCVNKVCTQLNKYEKILNVFKNNATTKQVLENVKLSVTDQKLIKQINNLLNNL